MDMTQTNPQVILGEAVAGQSATLRKRMRILASDLTKHTFDLAEAFLQAQETRCFTEWGFATFPEYAEIDLGIKPRKAQYLARIARVCRDCGVARKVYEPVGVTKLREITRLDPEVSFYNAEEKQHEPLVEHIVRLIAEAPELSTVEVEQEVARLKGMTGDNAMVLRAYKVTLSCWENVIAPCFESIRKRLGSAGRDGTGAAKEYTDGNVVECLAAEYNADPRNFMEEPDESQAQIEIALEETNDHAPDKERIESTEALPIGGRHLRGDGLGFGGGPSEVGTVDSGEVPQDTLQPKQERLTIPTEEDQYPWVI